MGQAIVVLSVLCLAYTLADAQPQNPPLPGRQGAAAAAQDQAPADVVKNAAEGMLGDLERDRATYRRDPAKIGQLVEKYLLPHFDTEYSARLVLGTHWRTAPAEQRQRFVDAFYHFLLNNYGRALVNFTADRLQLVPTKVDPDATRAEVRTYVKRDNGDRVQVDYYLHKTPQGWKAYDLAVEGIDYVNSYRIDFGEQIEAEGIDAVIKRLEAGGDKDPIGKQSGGKDPTPVRQ